MSDSSWGMQASLRGSIQALSETTDLHRRRADLAEGQLDRIKKRLINIRTREIVGPGGRVADIPVEIALADALNDVHDILNTGVKFRVPPTLRSPR